MNKRERESLKILEARIATLKARFRATNPDASFYREIKRELEAMIWFKTLAERFYSE